MCTLTLSGGSPAMAAAVPWSMVWNCVPTQRSQPLLSMRTVQFKGSIVACAR